MKPLKLLYWLAFILDVISGVIWLLTISVTFLIPFGITVALFVVHVKSYKQLNAQHYVSKKLIITQTILGILVAACFSIVIFALASLDCLDVCIHPKNWWLISGVPSGLSAFVISAGLAIAPYFLNRRLASKQNTR